MSWSALVGGLIGAVREVFVDHLAGLGPPRGHQTCWPAVTLVLAGIITGLVRQGCRSRPGPSLARLLR